MRKHTGLSIFLLFFQISFCAAQYLQKIDLELIASNKTLDAYPYNNLYKKYSSRLELDSIYALLAPKIKNPSIQQLNLIAFCNAIDLIGYHHDALDLLSKVNQNLTKEAAVVQSDYYQIMGNIALRSLNPELAIRHYQKSIAIFLSTKNYSNEILQSKYMSLGTGYNSLEQYEMAKDIFEKALAMETLGTNRNSLYLRLNMALTNSNLGQLELAKSYFKEALQMIKISSDVFAEVRTLGNLADIYLQQDSLVLAHSFYLEGRKKAMANGLNLDIIRFERSLSKLFLKQGNYQKAYQHFAASDSINTKFNSLDVSEQLAKMEMQLKVEKEKIQKELNQELLQAAQQQKKILLFFTLALLTACLALVWQLNQLKQKNQALLYQNLASIKNNLPKENSNVQTNDYTLLLESLSFEIETNKIYTAPDLTLEKLAKKLQTNRTYLSEAINAHFQLSFSKWINELRINESKKMLASPDFDQYSIEGIANMVGFTSISAYNANFKKITGITPSYFRKNRSFKP